MNIKKKKILKKKEKRDTHHGRKAGEDEGGHLLAKDSAKQLRDVRAQRTSST